MRFLIFTLLLTSALGCNDENLIAAARRSKISYRRKVKVVCYAEELLVYKSNSVKYISRSSGRYMFIDLEKGENVVQTSFDCLFTSYKEKK
jgi:hypothetical protein